MQTSKQLTLTDWIKGGSQKNRTRVRDGDGRTRPGTDANVVAGTSPDNVSVAQGAESSPKAGEGAIRKDVRATQRKSQADAAEVLYTLTEARVVLEDWRYKYNHLRPHRSLGYLTPLRFAQQEINEPLNPNQCWVSGRATPSLQPSIDFLNHLYHRLNNRSRLTHPVAHFA